jgi:hypothetical protein
MRIYPHARDVPESLRPQRLTGSLCLPHRRPLSKLSGVLPNWAVTRFVPQKGFLRQGRTMTYGQQCNSLQKRRVIALLSISLPQEAPLFTFLPLPCHSQAPF